MMEDILLVENKIGELTDFTIRQRSGFTTIKNASGNANMTVTYSVGFLNANQVLSINKSKCLKLWGDGTGSINNIEMEIITEFNF